jgi:hypothetical protein
MNAFGSYSKSIRRKFGASGIGIPAIERAALNGSFDSREGG